jgi:hypothetical protein
MAVEVLSRHGYDDQVGSWLDRYVARLADLPVWTPALTTLRSPETPVAAPAALASLVEAGARQYATHGYGSPVLLVHVATAPNAMSQLLPALPTGLWLSSFAATWAACAAITVAYAPAQAQPVPAGPGTEGTDPGDLMVRAASTAPTGHTVTVASITRRRTELAGPNGHVAHRA